MKNNAWAVGGLLRLGGPGPFGGPLRLGGPGPGPSGPIG